MSAEQAAIKLTAAAATGDMEQVREVLDNYALRDLPEDYDGRTALHLSSSNGHLEVVTLLLASGAQPSLTDRWGGTPLDDAKRNGHAHIAKALVDAGGVSGKRLTRALQVTKGSHVLDQDVLRRSILPLLGHFTFLEAYDQSGRILNICVTRSDGKAAPLMCNYLTTPQMLIYSACLASSDICSAGQISFPSTRVLCAFRSWCFLSSSSRT